MDPGAALQQAVSLAQHGRIADAVSVLERLIETGTDHPQVRGLLGTLHMTAGRTEAALPHLRRAHELAPDQAHLAFQLGAALVSAGRPLEGLPFMQRAVDLSPTWLPGLLGFARALQGVGDFDRAEAHYQRAIAADPGSADATCSLAGLYIASGRVGQAIDLFRRAARQHPTDAGVMGRLLSALNYADDATREEIFEAHEHWGRLVMARGTDSPAFPNAPDPDRRLRVGLLSTDLWDHSCAYFLRPILAAHDPARLELICYTTSTSDDWMTGELRARADGWRSVAGQGEDALINSLRADGLDILIELSGHTGNGPLAALRRRAAPVQAMYLGYPNTTGLPTIDWRLVDAVTDPPGAEHFSTERLARIDGCFLCYSGPVDVPPPPPPPPPPASPVTFGSFNSIRKIGPAVVRAWSAILLATPGSRLLIKTRGISTPAAARSFRSAFAECGIDAARLELMDGLPDKRAHLNLYGRLHLALDTFPYNGATTTCEALWMGVPVVTLSGAMHAGRVGASLLRAAGLPELVADSPDGFVALASGLAQNPNRLAATRAKVLAFRGSFLCDAAAFAPKFEAALRTMWREWCSRATPR